MKFFFQTLLLFFILKICVHQTALTAQPLEGYAEWLYLQPSIGDPYFAVQTNTPAGISGNPLGTRYANTQHWHSAYRLGLYYNICDTWAAEIRWTHFPNGKNHRSLNGVIPTLATPASAFVINGVPGVNFNDETTFHELDIAANINVWNCRDWFLNLRGGARYGRVSHREHVVDLERGVAGSTDFIDFSSKLYGFGPTIGCAFSAPLWCCFSIVGNANTSLLVSRIHAREHFQEFIPSGVLLNDLLFDNEPYWIAISTFDAEVGVDFSRRISFIPNCCFELNIQAGYAFITYFGAIDRIRTINTASNRGQTFDEYMNLLLHGPYIRLGICF